MNEIYLVIVVPLFVGLLGFLINRLRTEFDLVAFLLTLFYSIRIFIATRTQIISFNVASLIGIDFRFYADSLSGFIVLFNAIFALLIWLYSLRAMSKMPRERVYYLYLAITVAAANGVALSGNLIFLLLFWNVLVFSLYGMLQVGKVSPISKLTAAEVNSYTTLSNFLKGRATKLVSGFNESKLTTKERLL